MGAKLKLPQSAHFYLWYQLIGKRKPIQKALDNTYAYGKGLLDGEPGFPDEAEARRLLEQAAKLILKGGGNEIEKRTLVESLLRQKLMVIVKRFIQVVKKSLQITKLKRRETPSAPHFEAGVTQLVECLPSNSRAKLAEIPAQNEEKDSSRIPVFLLLPAIDIPLMGVYNSLADGQKKNYGN